MWIERRLQNKSMGKNLEGGCSNYKTFVKPYINSVQFLLVISILFQTCGGLTTYGSNMFNIRIIL